MTNIDSIMKAAEDFFDENEQYTAPFNPDGITGTSIGWRESGIAIIVHVNSSKDVQKLIPKTYKNYNVYLKVSE